MSKIYPYEKEYSELYRKRENSSKKLNQMSQKKMYVQKLKVHSLNGQ